MTLFDKGDFNRAIFSDVRTDTFILDSGDNKTQKLLGKYGDKIFGLNNPSKKEYLPTLKPVFNGLIQKELSHD